MLVRFDTDGPVKIGTFQGGVPGVWFRCAAKCCIHKKHKFSFCFFQIFQNYVRISESINMQIVKTEKYREVTYHILDTPEWVWANILCTRRVRVGITSKVYSLALV